KKVHRDDRELVEEEEEEEVERHVDPHRRRAEDQEIDIKLLQAVLHMPGDEDPCEHQEGGGQNHRGADPVDAEQKGDAELLRPDGALDKLKTAPALVERIQEIKREKEREAGEENGDP